VISEPNPPKLLDRMRTEDAYLQWAKRYILFHGKRHPSSLGAAEINEFLSHLAVERNDLGVHTEPGALRNSFSVSRCVG
jgi:hypothetical protein